LYGGQCFTVGKKAKRNRPRNQKINKRIEN